MTQGHVGDGGLDVLSMQKSRWQSGAWRSKINEAGRLPVLVLTFRALCVRFFTLTDVIRCEGYGRFRAGMFRYNALVQLVIWV